jgi:hypothetical protein
MNSLIPKPDGNVVDYFTGSTVVTYTKSGNYPWLSLSIINDGASDLTFTVNNITITVKANEEFTDNFEDFTTITINTNIAYRLALRG